MDAMIFPAGNAEVLPIHSHVFLEFLTYTKLINVYTPQKLTWIPKITIFERRYILKTIIFGIYVKFQGVTYYNKTRRNAKKLHLSPIHYCPNFLHMPCNHPSKNIEVPGINHTSPTGESFKRTFCRRKSHGIQSIQQGNLSNRYLENQTLEHPKNKWFAKNMRFPCSKEIYFQEFNFSPFRFFGEKNIPSESVFLFLVATWGFPKMVGFPNNHGFSY